MTRSFTIVLALLSLCTFTLAQNTIGLISLDVNQTSPGYNLFYPNYQSSVFLLDVCGEIVHEWPDHPIARPGAVVHLLESGSIIRAKADINLQTEPTFGSGGAGGTIEIVSWGGEVTWRYIIADSLKRAHHDIHVLPNGNVLAVVWERKNREEIIMMGFDTINNPHQELYSEAVYEINPENDSIVWSWHVWDHLVQDFDPSKPNYGNVKAEYDRINLNYQEYLPSNISDFLHINAIDYSPLLDQVILSVRNFNEIWIIDHSTSTEESTGSTGGASGKGGDLLFRWGNPEAYQAGTVEDRVFWQQHDAQWIQDPELVESEIFGKICVFNNYIDRERSLGQVIFPEYDTATNAYALDSTGRFFPEDIGLSFTHPDTLLALSALASSIQFLSNGNILMCAAQKGFMYELTQSGDVVWAYRTPLIFGEQVPQGTSIGVSQNFTNQVRRYPPEFPGFEGRDLSPKRYLELSPNIEQCMVTSTTEGALNQFSVYPNPASDVLYITSQKQKSIPYRLMTSDGRQILYDVLDFDQSSTQFINVSSLTRGLHFLELDGHVVKIVLQ